MAGRSLNIDINTNDQQTLAAIKRLQREFKGLDGSIDKTSKKGIGLGDALGGLALAAGAKYAIGEWEEAEQSARSTEAVIKSTGNAAEVSAKQQEELVTQLSRLAGIDDEVVNGGANMLRTFTSIKGENFGAALAASLDLAAFKGQDLATSAEMVGKALNNPLTGMTKLTKAGVVFSDQQKQQIRDFTAVGDVASAQKVILDELGTEFGGQAKAMATDSGRMKVALGEAAESAGKALAPSLKIAADAAGVAADVFAHIPAPLQATALGLLGVAYAGPKVVSGVSKANEVIHSLQSSLQLVPEKGMGAVSAMSKLSSVAAANPIATGAAVVGIGGLVYALTELTEKEDLAAEGAKRLAEEAQSTGKSAEEVFRDKLGNSLAGLSDGLDTLGLHTDQVQNAFGDIGLGASEVADGLTGTDKQFKSLMDSISKSAEGGSRITQDAAERARRLLTLWREEAERANFTDQQAKGIKDDVAKSTDKVTEADRNWLGVNSDQVAKTWERVDATRAANDEADRSIELAYAQTNADLALASAHDAVQDAQMALGKARNEGDAEAQQRAEDDLTAAMIREVQAADDLARKNAEVSGKHYDAGDSARVQRTRLFELMGQTGLTNDTLKTLADRLKLAAVKRRVALDTADADAAAESLLRKLERIQNLTGSLGSQQANGQPVRPGAINAERQSGGDAPRRRTAGGDASVVISGPVTIRPGDRQINQAERDARRKAGRKLRAA